MMIKYLRVAQRIGLELLILSILLFPTLLGSQEKDEGLELPEVYIYGTYHGRMQLSPKKDFFPYLSEGNLFPIARDTKPEFLFPEARNIPGKTPALLNYWILLDAGCGNWWSDRVFLDCGVKNPIGFLSFRFKDYRRGEWEENQSIMENLFKIKGALNKENYYISGNICYSYEGIIPQVGSLVDTVKTHIGCGDFFSLFNYKQFSFSVSSEFSMNDFFRHYFSSSTEDNNPETIKENLYKNGLKSHIPLESIDMYGNLYVEGATKHTVPVGEEISLTISSFDALLKKTFDGMFSIASGVRIFIGEGKVVGAPLFSLKTTIPKIGLQPFITYFRNDRINRFSSLYNRCPFVLPDNDYTRLSGKNISAGFDGDLMGVSMQFEYTHIGYDNYPVVEDSFRVEFSRKKKDVLKTRVGLSLDQFIITLDGSYTPYEKIPYEPLSKFALKTRYKGFSPFIIFASLEASLGIKRTAQNLDIFLLNGGAKREIFQNCNLRFEIENILNKRYEIWEGYKQGGIQFYLSLKYKITK